MRQELDGAVDDDVEFVTFLALANDVVALLVSLDPGALQDLQVEALWDLLPQLGVHLLDLLEALKLFEHGHDSLD